MSVDEEEEVEGKEIEQEETGQTITKPEDQQEVREPEQDDKEPIMQQWGEANTRQGYVILRVYDNKKKIIEITLISPDDGAFILMETVFKDNSTQYEQ